MMVKALGKFVRSACWPGLLQLACVAILTSGAFSLAASAATISNTASVSFASPSGAMVMDSNTVTLGAAPPPSPAVVSFYQYAPGGNGGSNIAFDAGYCGNGGGGFVPLPGVRALDGGEISLAGPVEVLSSNVYHINEPIFITLADANRNMDPAVREYIDVVVSTNLGDTETLRMQETGPDTGVFATVIQSVGPPQAVTGNDCQLSVSTNTQITVNYQDPIYLDDTSAADALVDPYGVVFDSITGEPLNGATVTMIDNDTGLPAIVFGDDGFSSYPASVITGSTVTDRGGEIYILPPGGFRFPFVAPGGYHFVVLPPAGYSVPSTVPTSSMPDDPLGNPYAVVAGSRGDTFVVLPGPALNIDIPADPSGGGLSLQKQVSQIQASAGDFLQYRLTLQNAGPAAASATSITDRLPAGMRYQAGSLHLNGERLGEPTISDDGRTVTFEIGSLAGGARAEISYVIMLGAGVRVGEAVNTAQASANAGALISNQAEVSVTIREPLFSGRFTIIGRVFEGSCETPWSELKGVADARVMLEDGTYVVTDKDGQYHFEGVRPGTHVVQLDVDTLPGGLKPEACIENTRFAGRSFSQFVDVKGGGLWRADFHTRARRADAGIRLQSWPEAEMGIRHRIEVDGGASVSGLSVMTMLPEGATYAPGSTRVDGKPGPDPELSGALATFALADAPQPGWTRVIEFRTLSKTSAKDCGAFKALARFITAGGKRLQTPMVETPAGCPPASGKKNTPDGGLDSTRKTVNLTSAGIAKAAPAKFQDRQKQRLAISDDATAAGAGRDWLSGQQPGVAWLFPGPDHNPRSPAVRIVIKHAPGQTVVLKHPDGRPVSGLNFDGSQLNAAKTVAVSVWRAVPLVDGANLFSAEIRDAKGTLVQEISQPVNYANSPASAVLVPEQSILVADGINRPVLAVRFLDRHGKPVRAGVTGPVALGAPYRTWQAEKREQTHQLSGLDRFEPQYFVEGDDGIAYIELAPTMESGAVLLNLNFQLPGRAIRSQEVRAWMAPEARDWVIVGFAEGTLGYNTLKEHGQSLSGDEDDGGYTDGQTKFYAKGRVLGKWLLTLSYDSDKRQERPRSLLGVIDPNEFYTLYGDGTEQRYDAASAEKLYLKLERGQFHALFGDYETGLTQTELSRYSRMLTGFKMEKGGGPVVFTVFATETPQNFARDEIQGDGTSGLYRLSMGDIVLNSERIRIETRDRLAGEKIIETRMLMRHIDYDIDYSNGTIFFRQPVNSRDTNFNPVIIVAEYETMGTGKEALNAGGRVGLNLRDGKVQLGITGIRDQNDTNSTDLGGADLKLRIGDSSELRVEAAKTSGRAASLSTDGIALLTEFEHHSRYFDALIFARRQEPGFGLNQLNFSTTGQQKIGFEGQVPLGKGWSLIGEAYQQESLGREITREAGSGKLQYETPKGGFSVGAQAIRDSAGAGALAGEESRSEQATASANRWFMDRKLELSAQAETSLTGQNNSIDFPDRYLIGAGYSLTENTRLLAGEEFTDGAYSSSTTRAGVQLTPWKGARQDTTINQSRISEYGPRTFGLFGLTQAVQVTEKWGVDFSVDSSHSFDKPDKPVLVVNPYHPLSAGGTLGAAGLTEDFTALSTGSTWRAESWSWNGRAESRQGETTDRYGLVSNFLRQAKAGVAFATSAQGFMTEEETGATGVLASVDLSWAWRPLGKQWSILDRAEFRYEDLQGGAGTQGSGLFGNNSLTAVNASSRRIINNFVLNRVSREWTGADRKGNLFSRYERSQWSIYYGAKYAFNTFDGVDYSGYTDLVGIEGRYDIVDWIDIGVQASSLNAWSAGSHSYSVGPMIGVSPATNSWITLGYNFRGFTDRDFDAARYTSQGPYLQLRFKFDQNTRWGLRRSEADETSDDRNETPEAAP